MAATITVVIPLAANYTRESSLKYFIERYLILVVLIEVTDGRRCETRFTRTDHDMFNQTDLFWYYVCFVTGESYYLLRNSLYCE